MLRFLAVMLIVATTGFSGAARAEAADGASTAVATPFDLQSGLHEMASVALDRSANRLGQAGGFYLTPEFHIALPATLDKPAETLTKTYAPLLPVDLERAINRAAESSVRPAGDYVRKVLATVVLSDPGRILNGSPTALTETIESQVGPGLREAMGPVI